MQSFVSFNSLKGIVKVFLKKALSKVIILVLNNFSIND